MWRKEVTGSMSTAERQHDENEIARRWTRPDLELREEALRLGRELLRGTKYEEER
jgi:hypothetical protein